MTPHVNTASTGLLVDRADNQALNLQAHVELAAHGGHDAQRRRAPWTDGGGSGSNDDELRSPMTALPQTSHVVVVAHEPGGTGFVDFYGGGGGESLDEFEADGGAGFELDLRAAADRTCPLVADQGSQDKPGQLHHIICEPRDLAMERREGEGSR